jgi:hypothetical protein
MSFVVSCQCGKQFRVKDDQAGKKAKCPGCGTALRLDPGASAPPPPPRPQATEDESDPFANFDLEAAAAMERNAVVDENQGPRVAAPPPRARASGGGGPQQKACPSCGSMISAFAMRCEHCGASFAPGGGGAVARPARAAGGGDSNLGLGIASMICGILSILTFCFWPLSGLLALLAILLGLRARGGGMAKAGIITACVGIVLLITWIVIVSMSADRIRERLQELERQEQLQQQQQSP